MTKNIYKSIYATALRLKRQTARIPGLIILGIILFSGLGIQALPVPDSSADSSADSSTGLAAGSADVFPVPDNLEDNVAFWKKIYTETSLQEGLLHDREYPLVIYRKLTIGKRKGRARRRYIRYHANLVKATLKSMLRKKPAQWNVDEQVIADLFRRHGNLDDLEDAHTRIRFQQGQRERFKQGLERSGAYMPYIRKVFRENKIPERIIYLPHVESSFNPRAYSRVGAAGMWQFMRRTGRLFMRIDYRVDERWDPIKSTEAAAKLLKLNYSHVKSWPLAITAYNHGLASMKRAVKVTGSRDIGIIIDRYKNRRFKFASKNFYGCFLAASEIAANAEKYFPGIRYHKPYKFNEYKLKRNMRPRTVAKYLGITQKQLKQLNPAIRSIVFRRQFSIPRGYRLRLPLSISQDTAHQKLAGAPIIKRKTYPKGKHYYSVERGDTLSGISRQFRVSTEALIIENEISREDRIYVGQVLRIPGRVKKTTAKPSAKIIAAAKPTVSKPVKLQTTTKPSPKISPAPDKQQKPVPALTAPKKRNLRGDVALEKPSRTLLNRGFDASIYNLEVRVLKSGKVGIATASLNETMGHYADWLGTSMRRLRQLNRGRRNIQVKQKVRIPIKHGTLERFKENRIEFHMAQEEDFYNQYLVVDVKYRKVKRNDTLWSICQDEEIPIWLFKKYNRDVNIERLSLGTQLAIPELEEKESNNNTNNNTNNNSNKK